MGKLVKANYDAGHNTLRLVKPLDGFKDDEEVDVLVTRHYDPEQPWLAFSGILSKEDGDDFARAINELFPPWNE
jgi:hypothetical protein